MGRPRKNVTDSFGHSEIAAAAGVTLRNVELLEAEQLLSKFGGTDQVIRAATIGAFLSAGLPLTVAGRVVRALELDVSVHANLEDRAAQWPEFVPEAKDRNDWHWHQAVTAAAASGLPPRKGGPYRPGAALPRDNLFELIDRRLVVSITADIVNVEIGSLAGPNLAVRHVDAVARLDGWGRDSNTRARPIAEELPTVNTADDVEPLNAKIDQLRREVVEARVNAVSIVRINASLAIRNALDRIAQIRAERLRKPDRRQSGGGGPSRDAPGPQKDPTHADHD